jgi:hypothetical protein
MHACRGGAARRRGASRHGWARRGRARQGETAATTTEEERREAAIWGKWLSADLEGDGAYIEIHHLLSRVVFPTVAKGPLVPGGLTTPD